ncbi:hypothetical protein J2X31_000726 [Flavobacterium arsenatis]|uniref:Type II toxin-antitoxin system RelE/ParE family toxin n=1 Tax=Flavobacterium arsenatis TaxID=1484332 RepID=A0ABU1TMT0_9FLAO|nr:hypothetical protein [Flavobacterium arsenatis]
MEKSIIVYLPEVEDYINDLVLNLFNENYFNYIENAIAYKDQLINFIESSISTFPPQKSPKALIHFGGQYIFYKSNQRTTWYVFFESRNNKYLITFITNNHSEDAKWF